MCTYIYTHTCVYVRAHTRIRQALNARIHAFMKNHIYTHTRMHRAIHTHIHAFIETYTHACMCAGVNPPELPSEGEDSTDDDDEHAQHTPSLHTLNSLSAAPLAAVGGEERDADGGGGGGPSSESAGVGQALVIALGAAGSVIAGDSAAHQPMEADRDNPPGEGDGEGGGGRGEGGEVEGDVNGFEALSSEVTWTAEWWGRQRGLDACRAAWCIRSLAFRERDLVLEVGVAPLLRRAIRVAADEDTDTACTWALLALE